MGFIRERINRLKYLLPKQIKCSGGQILLGRETGPGKAEEIQIGAGLTLSDGTLTASGGSPAWSDITGKPTTISGYGITDAAGIGDAVPIQTGSAGKVLTTDGTAASWTDRVQSFKMGAATSFIQCFQSFLGYVTMFVQQSPGNTLTISCAPLSGEVAVDWPTMNGQIAVFPSIHHYSDSWGSKPVAGGSITCPGTKGDQIHILEPGVSINGFSFVLPPVGQTRDGQKIRMVTTAAITNATVSAAPDLGGDSIIIGAQITAATIPANTMLEWQCIATFGTGIWVRVF